MADLPDIPDDARYAVTKLTPLPPESVNRVLAIAWPHAGAAWLRWAAGQLDTPEAEGDALAFQGIGDRCGHRGLLHAWADHVSRETTPNPQLEVESGTD